MSNKIKRVLFVDNTITGHHINYINALSNQSFIESIVFVPTYCQKIKVKQVNCVILTKLLSLKHKTPRAIRFLLLYVESILMYSKIRTIVINNKVDDIHFLTGDAFNKFSLKGLKKIKKIKTIVTLHRVNEIDTVRNLKISELTDSIVVHSQYLLNLIKEQGVDNAVSIEYPCFNSKIMPTERKKYNVLNDVKVLLVLGNARHDKGLDILLESLQKIDEKFFLIISTLDGDLDKEKLMSLIEPIKDKVYVIGRVLTDTEIEELLNIADIIPLPYRTYFQGASGPLVEGCWNWKCIIGPNHGNLGYTILQNHLGYVFNSEDVASLTETIIKALAEKFEPDETYKEYRNSLSVDAFCKAYFELY